MQDLRRQYENLTHREVVEAKLSGDMERLNEASLGRVYYCATNATYKSIGLITADQAGRTREQNLALNEKLGHELHSARHGLITLCTIARDCQDTDATTGDEKNQTEVREQAFAVLGIKKEPLASLCRKYDQNGVIYLGPETNGEAVLIFKNGEEEVIGRFNPQTIAEAYSRVRGVKGNTFIFEWVVQSYSDAMIRTVVTRNAGRASLLETLSTRRRQS